MRVAFGIEYDGTCYVGWQRQKTGAGVQALVEKAIGVVANEPVKTICAGRTDAGVHATAQVVHIDSFSERSERGWVLGINSNLPDDINVAWARQVDDEFHARFSATSRTYRYLILNQPVRSALLRRHSWWLYEELDEQAMQAAANQLVGRHDFSAFRAAGCQAASPVRDMLSIAVTRTGRWISIKVVANAFLQHMVRNMTGVLVAIGQGEQPEDWARTVLDSRDRTQGGVAAPPQGLTLIGVDYPGRFGIPQNSGGEEFGL